MTNEKHEHFIFSADIVGLTFPRTFPTDSKTEQCYEMYKKPNV